MRAVAGIGLAMALWLPSAVMAIESGTLIRADSLKDQPFIDAATTASLAADDPVTIDRRQGGWMQVNAAGKTGWVRMLNVRLAGGGGKPGGGSSGLLAAASLYKTGSSGKTVTTGVKGIGEEDLRNATASPQQVERLAALAVTPADATALASGNGLKTASIDYLKPGKKK